MRHLMSPLDFSVEELEALFVLANDIEKNMGKYSHACTGRKLATCFYEPSTRTRLSFESAMLNLGGSVIGFSDANSSSAAKAARPNSRNTSGGRPKSSIFRIRRRGWRFPASIQASSAGPCPRKASCFQPRFRSDGTASPFSKATKESGCPNRSS